MSGLRRCSALAALAALCLAACDPISWTRVTLNQPIAANYLYRDAKYFRVNFGWPLDFVSPVAYLPHDLALANSASGGDRFQVAFDSRAVVRYAGFFRGAAAAQYRAWPFEDTK